MPRLLNCSALMVWDAERCEVAHRRVFSRITCGSCVINNECCLVTPALAAPATAVTVLRESVASNDAPAHWQDHEAVRLVEPFYHLDGQAW
jgi:hypothetical protein